MQGTIISKNEYGAAIYIEREMRVGRVNIAVCGPRGDTVLTTQVGGDTVQLSFPTAKVALDWLRWTLFGTYNDPVRRAGEWLVTKFRTQIRAGAPERAEQNMTKQGVPADTRQFVLEGA